METKHFKLFALLLFLTISFNSVKAEDLRKIVSLS